MKWRWPWRKLRRDPSKDQEADRARLIAEAKLAETRRRDPHIDDVSDRLRELTSHNRFAEMMNEAFRSQ